MREQDMPVLEVYAEALVDACQREGVVDQVFEEAKELRVALGNKPELMQLLGRPTIRLEEKKALIRRVFEGKVSPLMLHLPLVLVDKNRGVLWNDVLEYFLLRLEEGRGIRHGTVMSAVVLADDQKERMQKSLEAYTGSKLRIRWKVDPWVLGGVSFRSGDLLLDNTLRSALRGMAKGMQEAKIGALSVTLDEKGAIVEEDAGAES